MREQLAAADRARSVTRRKFLRISMASGVALLAGKPDLSCGADATIPSRMATNPTFSLGCAFTVNPLGFGAVRVTGPGIRGCSRARGNAGKLSKRAVDFGVTGMRTVDSYAPSP